MTQIGLLSAKIQKPTTTMEGGRKWPLLSTSPISEGSENWLTDKTKELFFCTSTLVTHPQRRGKEREGTPFKQLFSGHQISQPLNGRDAACRNISSTIQLPDSLQTAVAKVQGPFYAHSIGQLVPLKLFCIGFLTGL